MLKNKDPRESEILRLLRVAKVDLNTHNWEKLSLVLRQGSKLAKQLHIGGYTLSAAILKGKIEKALQPSPKGPLKMKDDPVHRCYHFYDGNGKKFLTLDIKEIKTLSEEIRKYFGVSGKKREDLAKKEMSRYINMKKSVMTPIEIVATMIIESLREWAFQ